MHILVRGLSSLGAALSLIVCVANLGCSADPLPTAGSGAPALSPQARSGEASAKGAWSKVMGWGAGPNEVGLQRAQPERKAQGPSAMAVAESGAVLVLDRFNDRVVEITPDGARVVASVPRDTEIVAAGPNGALAAMSLLRAKAFVYDAAGEPRGDVAVPRVLRDIMALGLDGSHHVTVTSAFQETLSLGSPRAPKDLSEVLRSKREGAAFLADGRGVAAVHPLSSGSGNGGGIDLVVFANHLDERGKTAVQKRHHLSDTGSAARVAGAWGTVVCLRVEHVSTDNGRVVVGREALCADADSGAVKLRVDLPPPGMYAPHVDVAMRGPLLAAITPSEDGLSVSRWEVAR